MARAPVTALHQRIFDVAGSVTDSFAYDSAVNASLMGIAGNQAAIDALAQRVDALDAKVAIIAHRQLYWLWRLMMYNVDNKTGKFVPDTPFAKLLVDAKYPDVQTIANTKGGRGQKPWQKIHEDLKAVYEKDPKTYSPPPDPAETETFYEICVATT